MSFDRISRHYRWLETLAFGSTLQKARTRWIESIDSPKRILILGEGDGRFLCEFLRVHPDVAVDCVDSSARMLDLARGRVTRAFPQATQRVRFLCADLLSWSPPGSYDLLVANFVLDCFPRDEFSATIGKLAQAAGPDAHLFLADFSIPNGVLARIHARLWLAVMYWFFWTVAGVHAKELIDPTSDLEANGFICLARSKWRFSLVKSELWRRGQG